MLGNYTCYYIHNSGEVCGRGCRRPEGCFDHWKSKKRFPYKVCGKPTSSEPGLCRAHVKGYYVMKCLYGQSNEKFTPKKCIEKFIPKKCDIKKFTPGCKFLCQKNSEESSLD
ncbi:hypothetical protein Glove_155g150 [Diversispora epigaea]|uniref:Uncharacterized protein n=1 Tax=Diversispora epigaea TaxID=1348612 RepID=A0A397IWQ9_9GLOM|nr:hypothetical protein Glove_155g150 [Diversispora epigaea]